MSTGTSVETHQEGEEMTEKFGVPARTARCDWCRKRLTNKAQLTRIHNATYRFCPDKPCEKSMKGYIEVEAGA